jgi:hypothetical protein
MKILIMYVLLVSASFAQARQYIQCSDVNPKSTDGTVINLDGDKSTLFMTTGVDDPDEMRILKSIKFLSADKKQTIYQSRDGHSIETVTLPSEIIGKTSNKFFAELDLQAVDESLRMSAKMICFSAIY